MSIITPNEDGKSDCSDEHWVIRHNGTELLQFEYHEGRVTTPDTLECFDDETEARERVAELGLTDPDGLLDEND